MQKEYSAQFEPIYFMGWIIQPTLEGWAVYDRQDSSKPRGKEFEDIGDAMRFIEEQVSWRQ